MSVNRINENFDEISKAEHYNSSPANCKQGHQIECIDMAQHWTFNLGSALKYMWRHGLKPGNASTKDLRKAIQYLEYEIKRIEKGDTST